jgi:Arf-GAP/coiled-coil/ANK repeat/PH domain-containing protein
MAVLDIRGCLEDSPTFRKRIQAHEESIQNFEQSLKTLIKLARSQVELSTG